MDIPSPHTPKKSPFCSMTRHAAILHTNVMRVRLLCRQPEDNVKESFFINRPTSSHFKTCRERKAWEKALFFVNTNQNRGAAKLKYSHIHRFPYDYKYSLHKDVYIIIKKSQQTREQYIEKISTMYESKVCYILERQNIKW